MDSNQGFACPASDGCQDLRFPFRLESSINVVLEIREYDLTKFLFIILIDIRLQQTTSLASCQGSELH